MEWSEELLSLKWEMKQKLIYSVWTHTDIYNNSLFDSC